VSGDGSSIRLLPFPPSLPLRRFHLSQPLLRLGAHYDGILLSDLGGSTSLISRALVKQWDAHLLTKQHRQSVAREKAQAQAAVQAHTAKRPAETSVEALGESSKRPRVEAKAKAGPKGLPEGFFSSGNRPAPEEDEEGEDEDADHGGISAGPSTVSAPAPAAAPTTAVAVGPPQPTGDDELDAFLFSIAQPEPEQIASAPAPTSASEYSIVARGPRKGVPAYKELIPGQASYEAAPVKIIAGAGESAAEEEAEPEETEAEKRERLAREEKEEIMGRLEEEERAQ
jgi:zinc finger protein 830